MVVKTRYTYRICELDEGEIIVEGLLLEVGPEEDLRHQPGVQEGEMHEVYDRQTLDAARSFLSVEGRPLVYSVLI
jgi:hypothetical protein